MTTLTFFRIKGLGDQALVVNGHVVTTVEPGLDDVNLFEISTSLAAALGEKLEERTLDIPSGREDDWIWVDLIADAESKPGRPAP